MKRLIFPLVLFFAVSFLFADYNMSSLFDALKNKYGNLKSVSATIYNKADKIEAKMIAEKGNKYYINANDVILVSNGETIWNYSKKDNKVVISSVDSYDVKQSLDYIFFTFMTDFDPVSMNDKGKSYLLELVFNKKMNTTIDKLFLKINKKNLTIEKIQMQSGYSVQTWEIKNLKLDPKIKDGTFKFKIPKDAEVVDLR
jgi:outer membrane lipoprotein-sorting protein